MCRRYSLRPSEAAGIQDSWLALDFDLAMAAVHRAEERSQAEQYGQPVPWY